MFRQITQRRARNGISLPTSMPSLSKSFVDRDRTLPLAQPAAHAAQTSLEYAEQHGHHFGQYAIFSQQEHGEHATTALQRLANSQATAEEPSSANIHRVAQQGIRTPASSFPYSARIQQSFGHHNISRIQTHLGAQAAKSAEAIRASAYTTGNHVVFARKPDLQTAAHEAAHVVQQRAGVKLAQGIGQAGDIYEQHAEAVAQQVTAGQSAEALLDHVFANHTEGQWITPAQAESAPPVQSSQPVQRVITTTAPALSTTSATSASSTAATTSALSTTSATSASSTTPATSAPSTASVTPALSATSTGTPLEGECGYFERRRTWSVSPPTQGIIIQHVQRNFDVYKFNTTNKLTPAEIDALVPKGSEPYATETDYWELWEVDANGNVSDGGEDTFSLCSIKRGRASKNTTKGKFIITGKAYFYPTTANPTAFGFAKNAVKAAGGLYSMTTAPQNNLAAAGSAVQHTVTVEWDSTFKSSTTRYQPYAKKNSNQSGKYTNQNGLTILSKVTET